MEDTKKIKDHPDYHNVMADIWNYYLKIGGDQHQKFEFKSLLSDKSLMKTSAVYNFIGTLSKLDPTIQYGVVQLAEQLAQAMPDMSTFKYFNQNFDDFFSSNEFSLTRKIHPSRFGSHFFNVGNLGKLLSLVERRNIRE